MGSLGSRKQQKGLDCSIAGCNGIRKTRDMCTKHDMALRRYGNVLGGKVGRYKTCKGCGNEFEISKTDQEYCSNKCYKSSPDGRVAAYAATKAYRLRNKEKLLARGIFRRKPLPES